MVELKICPSRFLLPMSTLNVKKRIVSIVVFVSAFVVFAIGSDVQIADGSCGDYLNHARSSRSAVFSDMGTDSMPMPVCQGGNCRSAPSLPPVEPSRIVLPPRQPSDFQPTLTSLNSTEVRSLESVDDALPSSATLEVLTPPPILIV